MSAGRQPCGGCGTPFFTTLPADSPSYCSMTCFVSPTLPLEYGTGFTEALKAGVRARDGHRCRICGLAEDRHPTSLNVHHYVSPNRFLDPDEANVEANLITLCASCHGKVERGSLGCPRP